MTEFRADPAFEAGSVFAADWPLCQVRLQDDARFPWLILLPRVDGLVGPMSKAITSTPYLLTMMDRLSRYVVAFAYEKNYFVAGAYKGGAKILPSAVALLYNCPL